MKTFNQPRFEQRRYHFMFWCISRFSVEFARVDFGEEAKHDLVSAIWTYCNGGEL